MKGKIPVKGPFQDILRDHILTNKTIQKIISWQFNILYYYRHDRTWDNTFWRGYQVKKAVSDLWVYQEIIHSLNINLIIEGGTHKGGSVLYFANMLDLVNKDNGRVITIDIEEYPDRPIHDKINYLIGSTISDDIIEQVKTMIHPKDRILVVLDDCHDAPHVLEELNLYSKFNPEMIIVEDTFMSGHPVRWDWNPAPWEAVEEFLKTNDDYIADRGYEKFYLTQNPKGYLIKSRRWINENSICSF